MNVQEISNRKLRITKNFLGLALISVLGCIHFNPFEFNAYHFWVEAGKVSQWFLLLYGLKPAMVV